MIFKVKAYEIWTWEQEVEAKNKEELEWLMEENFLDIEDAKERRANWKIVDEKNGEK